MTVSKKFSLALGVGLLLTLISWGGPLRAQDTGGTAPVQPQPTEAVKKAPEPSRRVPVIDLYTMGPGAHLFSLFGHSALCVTDAVYPRGVCYNYGTTDFSQPVQLVWDFLNGDVTFWVSRDKLRRMQHIYESLDRSVYRQRLPFSPDEARRMAARLATDAKPENREYLYHHFFNNCATRLRDHIDVITNGSFGAGTEASFDMSIREMVKHWTAGNIPLQLLAQTILARTTDPPATIWQAMFLPDVLREEVTRKFGVEPEVLYARKGPLPTGSPDAGVIVLLAVGALAGALGFVSVRARSSWLRRLGLIVVSLPLLFWAAVVDLLVLISDVPELYLNELVVVLLPTDLVLWVAKPPFLRVYAKSRLIGLAIVALLGAAGVLQQPLLGPAGMVALAMFGLVVGLAGMPDEPEVEETPGSADEPVSAGEAASA